MRKSFDELMRQRKASRDERSQRKTLGLKVKYQALPDPVLTVVSRPETELRFDADDPEAVSSLTTVETRTLPVKGFEMGGVICDVQSTAGATLVVQLRARAAYDAVTATLYLEGPTVHGEAGERVSHVIPRWPAYLGLAIVIRDRLMFGIRHQPLTA